MNTAIINILSMAKPVVLDVNYRSEVAKEQAYKASSKADFPLFFLIYKSMRSCMCCASVSLQYNDYASAASAAIISRLSDELKQWKHMYQSIENSLCRGLDNHYFLLAQMNPGNDILQQLVDEMQGDAQRWMAADDSGTRLQQGAILCYRFHEFTAHALYYMNHCETAFTAQAEAHDTAKEIQSMNRQLMACFTADEWIAYSLTLLPAVSEKDRKVWMRYMQEYLPLSAWYPYANADDLFMTLSNTETNPDRKRNLCSICAARQGKLCHKMTGKVKKKDD